jgi:cobaltochelatase CobT
MKPTRSPSRQEPAGVGSARTAGVVLRALAASGAGRMHADAVLAVMTPFMPADMVAPAAAYDSAVRDRWRGGIDALAVRARFSDPVLHARLIPAGREAAQLFSLLEQMRVETLGARLYPGISRNLENLLRERWSRSRPGATVRLQVGWIETFALLARAALGAPLPDEARAALAIHWRRWMSPQEIVETEALTGLLENQRAFARQSLRVIVAALGTEEGQAHPDSAEQSTEDNGPVQSGALSHGRDPQRTADPGSGPVAEARGTRGAGPAERPPVSPLEVPYRVYTRTYDEIVTPAQLFDAATLARHRHELDTLVERHLGSAMRWAQRLQRQLLTQQKRSWEFDQDEGLLDAARLTRIVTRPLESVVYKREREAFFPGAVVSMLVDNSGSMRGESITTAALCVELLGRVLERCSVRTEVLGYTTRTWHGGRAYERWCREGRPHAPGRLGELRHIVYKSAEQPWRRARTGLGAMLDENLLKDNVDGEALLWAHERLQHRPETRRILIVICDGEPMEDATRQANDPEYLERHLRAVIRDIERGGRSQLVGIGIDHNVQRLYPHAVKVRKVEDLGEAIARQLLGLFR